MGAKKKVALRPFHEVAFETMENGRKSELYKQLDELVGFGQDAPAVVALLLARCIVPEKERPRIVPALIAASKNVGGYENGEVNIAVARALAHFHPGKRGLKTLGKLLSEEYLKTERGSDEADNLEGLLIELKLEVPERPKKEGAKGGKKKPKPKKPLTR